MDLRKWAIECTGTTRRFKALVANRMVPTLRGLGLGRVGIPSGDDGILSGTCQT